jgi:hypothetical protein
MHVARQTDGAEIGMGRSPFLDFVIILMLIVAMNSPAQDAPHDLTCATCHLNCVF